jgi:hypothetical protein
MPRLSRETVDRARELLREPTQTWRDVSVILDCSVSRLRHHFKSEFRGRARVRRPKQSVAGNIGLRVPPHVLAERDRLLDVELTANQELLGDPLPGRSALDQKIKAREADSCSEPF